MKRIFLSLALMVSISACQTPSGSNTNPSASPTPTPSGNTGTGVSGNLSTKAKYIDFLNCVNSQPNLDPMIKLNIDSQMRTLASVTDDNWALASTTFTTFFNTNSATYPACKG